MKKITGGTTVKYAFDPNDAPCLHVSPGESFQVETISDDPFGVLARANSDDVIRHQIREEYQQQLLRYTPPLVNAVTGPVYVEGCEPGDLLAVDIEWIEPGPYGYAGIMPGVGPLHDSREFSDCAEAFVHLIQHLPGPSGTTRDGLAKYADNITWELQPFVGTLAVAPDREVQSSIFGQGPWGGNIDCRELRAGHTVLLNAYVEGGLLYVGDVHGGQGDTEFAGLADETTATLQLNCSVIKNRRISGIRIIKPHTIVAVGINRPLERSVLDACLNLIGWMRDEYGISPRDAYMRMSVDPGLRIRIYQMVESATLKYVAGAEYPTIRLLPGL